tara:strand:- start:1042 stop:3606 length:2565 start_codon:yes stop_codon:yes gene_type:complete
MATNMGYPNAGIVSVIGQQENPMGGVVQPRNTNMFNPQESVEDTIIRLFQTNVPIDQIAAMTGTDSTTVAQVINNSTGMDTYANIRPTTPPIGAPDIEVEQEVFSTDLPNDMGTQALVGLNPQYAQMNPNAVDEARKMEVQIQNTSRDVFGIGENDPNLVQELNAVELSVLEDFESEGDGTSSGVGGSVQENALVKIGLNDVFTDANIDIEDRIDFFKHYIAETLGLDYGNLKDAPDEGLPFLAAASALLNASKSGDSRMSGIGQAMVSFGMTKNQLERIRNKDAKDLLMTSFNLGLESHKMAQEGDKGVGNIGEYIIPSMGDQPLLMGDKEALAFQRSGLNLRKYNPSKENPKTYAIPRYNSDKSGVVYEYKEMTPTAAGNVKLDGDLIAAGYTVNPVDSTNARTFGFIKSPEGEIEQISMQEYLTLPASDPRKGWEFTKAGDTQAVFDMQDGQAKFITKAELIKNPIIELEDGTMGARYVPNTMMKTWTMNPDGTFTMMEGRGADVRGYAGSRAQLSEMRETREKLVNLDLGTRKVLDDIDRVKSIARKGLFGNPAGLMSAFGNIIASTQEAYEVYRKGLVDEGKAIQGQSYDSLYANFKDKYEDQIMNYAWAPKLVDSGVQKDRITAGMFGLAISSAKLLAEQKGRDISNADIERFMQEIGANASSLYGFQNIINDLEHKVLQNYLRQAGPDGIYRDTQLLIDNPDGPDLPKIGSLETGNQYFAPGARGDKTLEFINERLEALGIEKKNLSTASGGLITTQPSDPKSSTYSNLVRGIKADKSGKADKIVKFASSGETMSWGRLAKQIVYDEVHGDAATAQQVTIQMIKDAFPDTDAGRADMQEFMEWYTSF